MPYINSRNSRKTLPKIDEVYAERARLLGIPIGYSVYLVSKDLGYVFKIDVLSLNRAVTCDPIEIEDCLLEKIRKNKRIDDIAEELEHLLKNVDLLGLVGEDVLKNKTLGKRYKRLYEKMEGLIRTVF